MKYIKILLKPFVTLIVDAKFKNIWDLKNYIKKNNLTKGIYTSYYYNYFNKHGSYIGPNSSFKDVPCFPHGIFGVFISNNAEIGKNCIIFQQVTIGSDTLIDSKKLGSPIIGDNVYIGAGAKIIGKIRVGNNCRIGANAVVYEDVPENSVVVASKTRIIKKDKELDNRFIIISKDAKYYYENGKYKKLRF